MALRIHRCQLLVVIGIAGTLACAGGPTPTTATRARNRDRMDTTEFRRPEFATMYDAVRQLHPEWLRVVGGPAIASGGRQTPVVGVFIEGDVRGYLLDKLNEFVPGDVKLVRRISPTESVGTYGTQWPWGGIVITRAR